jgi:cystathionine gamma-lyase
MKKEQVKDTDIITKAVHAGSWADKETGAIIPPIYQTSTYLQESPGNHKGYEYTRSHNPTRTRLETALAELENGKHALVTSSGLSSISLILHRFKEGSKIVCSDDVYGGTYRLLTTVFNNKFTIKFLDLARNDEETKKEILDFSPDLIWSESISNPLLKEVDLNFLSTIAKEANALLAIDSTFSTPINLRPLEFNADIVIHSMTKYLNGHSDIVGGAIITNDDEIYNDLWTLQNSIGPSQSPFDSWLTLRGLKTLAIRMEKHNENGKRIADYLNNHPKIEKVLYPNKGGMVSIFIKSDPDTFLKNLQIFSLAESLGGIESLIEHPASMTHAAIPKEVRKKIGITDNLIRLSVGIENYNDLIKDLENAL